MVKIKYDEIGYWSEIKLDILREYAQAYSRIMHAQRLISRYIYIDAFAGAGYGLYRTGIGYMDKVAKSYGTAAMAVNRRIKQALDPNGIIAPGKSGIHL